jgi:FlaA1/EpsC-like NDP-sugar epimerase
MTKKLLSIGPAAKFKSYCRFSLERQLRSFRKKCTSINFWIILLCDSLCILLAYLFAYGLRFEAFLIHERQLYYAGSLILIFGIKLPVFYFMGLYDGMWRYTSLSDLQNIIKAVLLSSVTIVAFMLFVNRFHGFSRAVFIMDAIISLLLLCGSRIFIRYLLQHTRIRQRQKERPKPKKRLLLIGAGDAAEKVVREISDNPDLPYELVGFVDDDSAKTGMYIHGLPILGITGELGEIAEHNRAEELLIAIVAVEAAPMKRIVDLCQQTRLPFKVLPGLGELIEGRLSVTAMRDISYSDLLGRAEVKLDQERIGGYVTGKNVLVTGAGGSIGSELCRQLLRFQPGLLILFDAGEENLYGIQMDLEHEHSFKNYVTILGQVQNSELLDKVFKQYTPDVVFHAAAYKHVPLLEINPWEAVFNNVLAVQKLMETAIAHKTRRFVLVSTDKAVRPTNVMGASKRLTELLLITSCQRQQENGQPGENGQPATAGHKMACMAVRFGNVLGSSGSVIPLFRRQIEHGGPVTVTHPEITRYFMSIEEAAQLILQAGAMGGTGEIFLLKMGTPIKIADLARDLIKLMGREPETDIKIAYTGLRPGEKLYEELITEGEGVVVTRHEKIMVLQGDCRPYDEMAALFEELFTKANLHDATGLKAVLQEIIPEYVPDYGARAVVQPASP